MTFTRLDRVDDEMDLSVTSRQNCGSNAEDGKLLIDELRDWIEYSDSIHMRPSKQLKHLHSYVFDESITPKWKRTGSGVVEPWYGKFNIRLIIPFASSTRSTSINFPNDFLNQLHTTNTGRFWFSRFRLSHALVRFSLSFPRFVDSPESLCDRSEHYFTSVLLL